MSNSINIKLKELRIENNYSQAYVAEYLNISRQAISNWENGKSAPDLDNIVLLAKLYNISTDELLGNASHSPETTPTKAESIISMLETLGLSIIIVLSAQFPFVPVIISILIIFWMKKNQRKYMIVYILCAIFFIVGIYNSYIFFIHFIPNTGTSTIVKV